MTNDIRKLVETLDRIAESHSFNNDLRLIIDGEEADLDKIMDNSPEIWDAVTGGTFVDMENAFNKLLKNRYWDLTYRRTNRTVASSAGEAAFNDEMGISDMYDYEEPQLSPPSYSGTSSTYSSSKHSRDEDKRRRDVLNRQTQSNIATNIHHSSLL